MEKQKKSDHKFIRFLYNHQQWVGFSVLVVALLYAFITLLFEPREVIEDIAYGLFFALLIWGLFHAFKTERKIIKKINFKSIDGVFIIFSVIITYAIAHNLGLSAVIASSFIGILGYIFFPKQQVAIYCGSFAGMVSTALFNYYEVLFLAIVCAFIFLLTKPLFKGYGGKLGTIAFMSSLITFSIFHEEYFVLPNDFNFWLLLVSSMVSVAISYYVQHRFSMSAVFASAVPSFIFALIIIYLFPAHTEYAIIFYSASFIGMSSKERLPNIGFAIFSGLVLGLIYYIFLEYFHGLGGKLGLMALMSVIITTGITSFFKKFNATNKE